MNIFARIKFILTHPLNQHHKIRALFRIVKWQVSTRLNPYPVIYPFTGSTKLIIHRGMTGATGNIYCGLHDYSDMGFLLHLLREEDCFVDIGANIGSYTILASGHVGAKTFSFEPVPSTFSNLVQNIAINNIQQKAIAYNIALGSEKGKIGFNISAFDTMNHVAEKSEAATINVPVELLDDVLQNAQVPLLLKIDVEGFETEVIKGSSRILEKEGLKAIIIELNGSGSRYGYDDREVHNALINLNFRPYQYDPKSRVLSSAGSFGTVNTIYIRDLNFVQQRLSTAPKIKILDSEI
jgi:FkbM family methyltransferase